LHQQEYRIHVTHQQEMIDHEVLDALDLQKSIHI
jgi:hypothetical protein